MVALEFRLNLRNSTSHPGDTASGLYPEKLGESLDVLGELGSTWNVDLTLIEVDQG